MSFDYIICGSGISGSYLAYSLSTTLLSKSRSILILDSRSLTEREESKKNLSFWSKDTFPFSKYAEKTWSKISLYNDTNSLTTSLDTYRYYSITEGILQKSMWGIVNSNHKICFKKEHIVEICNESDLGCVKTNSETYYAPYIFDSVSLPTTKEKQSSMRGKSWRISFDKPAFDEESVTFMDFRTLTTKELMFFYILPISRTRGVIEVAHFAHPNGQRQNYELLLRRYLSIVFPEKEYTLYENKGAKNDYALFIPKIRKKKSIIRIGRAAGLIKPTSGFGVIKIFQDTRKLVHALNNDLPIPEIYSGIPYWLSDLCMSYMTAHKGVNSSFFMELFRNYSADTVLSFLNEEASAGDLSKLIRVPVSLIFSKMYP